MLLTISTTHQPATDLGYLLHKNPAHLQTFTQTFGRAHVFYPEVSAERCTAALLLDVDPVQLVRGKDKAQALEQYVNDRPYVMSSFVSVALADVFGTALSGRCKQKPELVESPLPLEAHLSAVPCHGGESWLRRLFEPLGYEVVVQAHLLDEQHPEWGESPYYSLDLRGTCRLSELLTHIYVLVPVLDGSKHYWIGDAEVEKLLLRGKGWLEAHPERDIIVARYLRYRRSLIRDALDRLLTQERDQEEDEIEAGTEEQAEALKATKTNIHEQRLQAVLEKLQEQGARSVLDLGCGEGKLLQKLLAERQFERIVGLDVSYRTLEIAQRRLHLERMPERLKAKLQLLHGSLTYRDKRLEGFDAAAVVEVIEHMDEARLVAFERVLFQFARPKLIVITTPNAEYNVKFATLAAGTFRHVDHRFEWTREQFELWGKRNAERSGYTVQFHAVGDVDEQVGALTQMAVFVQA